MPTPTAATYTAFYEAYRYFNDCLFDGRLPDCHITLQRKARSQGYFKSAAFEGAADAATADEIALHPGHFRPAGDRFTLSVLVHEMVHCWQAHFGKPSRPGYHNAEWADRMEAVGLIPSHDGSVGGRRVGQRMRHWIIDGGPFDRACAELLAGGFTIPWADRAAPKGGARPKPNSKVKYSCPTCGLNAWAKPAAELVCQTCLDPLRAEDETDAAYTDRRRRWVKMLLAAIAVMAERNEAAARADEAPVALVPALPSPDASRTIQDTEDAPKPRDEPTPKKNGRPVRRGDRFDPNRPLTETAKLIRQHIERAAEAGELPSAYKVEAITRTRFIRVHIPPREQRDVWPRVRDILARYDCTVGHETAEGGFEGLAYWPKRGPRKGAEPRQAKRVA